MKMREQVMDQLRQAKEEAEDERRRILATIGNTLSKRRINTKA
jgi:hypothetical protein